MRECANEMSVCVRAQDCFYCTLVCVTQLVAAERNETQHLFLVNWQKIVVVVGGAAVAASDVTVVNKSKQSFDTSQ